LTHYYKILNGLSPITATEYFLIYSPITSTRSNMPSLLKTLPASSKLASSFFYRNVDARNHLPSNIKLLTSLNSFKSSIKLFYLSAFFKVFVFQLTMSYGIIVRFIMLYLNLIDYAVSTDEWPLLQCTCMYYF